MKIFNDRAADSSRVVALFPKEWLQKLTQPVKPWISEDFERVRGEVQNLQRNFKKPGPTYLPVQSQTISQFHGQLFDVGALSKTLNDTFVVHFLSQHATEAFRVPLWNTITVNRK